MTKQSSGVGEQDYWSAQDRGVGASGGVVDTLPMAATLADLVEEDEGEDGYVSHPFIPSLTLARMPHTDPRLAACIMICVAPR